MPYLVAIVVFFITALDLRILFSFRHFGGVSFLIVTQLISTGVGLFFVKKVGLKTLFFLEAELRKQELIAEELWKEGFELSAGILLLFPGLLTDLFGGCLLIPQVQDYLLKYIIPKNLQT